MLLKTNLVTSFCITRNLSEIISLYNLCVIPNHSNIVCIDNSVSSKIFPKLLLSKSLYHSKSFQFCLFIIQSLARYQPHTHPLHPKSFPNDLPIHFFIIRNLSKATTYLDLWAPIPLIIQSINLGSQLQLGKHQNIHILFI